MLLPAYYNLVRNSSKNEAYSWSPGVFDKVYWSHSAMFSQREKITARPGVFRVSGVTQYFVLFSNFEQKMAENM